MYTLIENTLQTIEDFDSIKDAIEYKDVTVPENAPTSTYADLIRSIEGGDASNAIFIESEVWEEVDLPIELRIGTLYTFASKGCVYLSTNSNIAANNGIWKFDKTTKIFTRIHSTGYNWRHWFETSQGEVFVSSAVSTTVSLGIWKLNENRDGLIQVFTTGYSRDVWFETSLGEVFAASTSTTTNINVVKLNDTRDDFITVLTPITGIRFFFEGSNADIFTISSVLTYYGIYQLMPNRISFDKKNSGEANWSIWFKSSIGEVFVANTSMNGILKQNITRNGFDLIPVEGMNWILNEVNGNIFINSTNSTPTGIWKLNENRDGIVQVYNVYSYYNIWKEFQGDWFITSSTSGVGIVKYNIETELFTLVHPNGRWGYFVEHNETLFTSSPSSSFVGIMRLNDTKSGFDMVSSMAGYQFIGQIGLNLISNVNTHPHFPIFNLEDLSWSKFKINGTVVGDWIINIMQFTKFTNETPMEVFIPSTYVVTLTPIGDADGNVFMVTTPKLIFNVKPLQ